MVRIEEIRLLQLFRLVAVTIPRSIGGGLRGWLERTGEGVALIGSNNGEVCCGEGVRRERGSMVEKSCEGRGKGGAGLAG